MNRTEICNPAQSTALYISTEYPNNKLHLLWASYPNSIFRKQITLIASAILKKNKQKKPNQPQAQTTTSESPCPARGAVPFYCLNPTLHRYVSLTFIHISESSHICPGQEYFMSTQPPPAPSDFIFFLYRPKNSNQSRQEWLCFQTKEVCVKVWVGEGNKKRWDLAEIMWPEDGPQRWSLQSHGLPSLVSEQRGHGPWQLSLSFVIEIRQCFVLLSVNQSLHIGVMYKSSQVYLYLDSVSFTGSSHVHIDRQIQDVMGRVGIGGKSHLCSSDI